MADQGKANVVFKASNVGKAEFPYKTISSEIAGRSYVGFYTNGYGEQWIFIYNEEQGGGFLMGSDVDWKLFPLGNGPVPVHELVLNEAEQYWLMGCWMATLDIDRREGGGIPKNLITLGVAATIWGIAETTLKRRAVENKLAAKKMGNVWITTFEDMVKAFGKPNTKNRNDNNIFDEAENSRNEAVEEMRKILAGE